MNEPKRIETPEDFAMAMGCVKSAMQLLSSFDWQYTVKVSGLFEGVGNAINPEVYAAMQKDPQWEQKKQLFKAAADFTRVLHDIQKQLKPDPAQAAIDRRKAGIYDAE